MRQTVHKRHLLLATPFATLGLHDLCLFLGGGDDGLSLPRATTLAGIGLLLPWAGLLLPLAFACLFLPTLPRLRLRGVIVRRAASAEVNQRYSRGMSVGINLPSFLRVVPAVQNRSFCSDRQPSS